MPRTSPGRARRSYARAGLRPLSRRAGRASAPTRPRWSPMTPPTCRPLLLGKLFRGLGGGEVAICPARGGGLVALATRLPAPHWLGAIDLDTPDAPSRLRAAAGRPGAVRSGPGWHRLRTRRGPSRPRPRSRGLGQHAVPARRRVRQKVTKVLPRDRIDPKLQRIAVFHSIPGWSAWWRSPSRTSPARPGVSVSTVSRAFTAPEMVREETRQLRARRPPSASATAPTAPRED